MIFYILGGDLQKILLIKFVIVNMMTTWYASSFNGWLYSCMCNKASSDWLLCYINWSLTFKMTGYIPERYSTQGWFSQCLVVLIKTKIQCKLLFCIWIYSWEEEKIQSNFYFFLNIKSSTVFCWKLLHTGNIQGIFYVRIF